MVLYEIYQRLKGHFLNELRVSFNLQIYKKIAEVFLWNFQIFLERSILWDTCKELFLS